MIATGIMLIVKRCMDIFGGGLVLLLTAPILALGCCLVLVTMGRPIFFRQTRIGRGEQPFTLVKLRTMSIGDDDDAARLTPVGRFLRASSIDELPSLVQVLAGDMSLVGPRPLLPAYLELYDNRQRRRHEVKPGLTGLAQIAGRNQIDWADRLELDVRYVETHAPLVDLAILAKTPWAVLSSRGIAADGHATMPSFEGNPKCDC